jgi:hypothetical protein
MILVFVEPDTARREPAVDVPNVVTGKMDMFPASRKRVVPRLFCLG